MHSTRKLALGAFLSAGLAAALSVGSAAQAPPAPLPPRLLGWGGNALGQTGVNISAPTILTPDSVALPAGRVAAAIDAGGQFSLAALDDGTVAAWGANASGQLGQGSADTLAHAPALVPGFDGVTAVAAGDSHSLAIRGQSVTTVWAWGDGALGQLGTGISGAGHLETSPVEVPGLAGVRAIAAGALHSLAVLEDGSVWAWGDGSMGQLGNGVSGAG